MKRTQAMVLRWVLLGLMFSLAVAGETVTPGEGDHLPAGPAPIGSPAFQENPIAGVDRTRRWLEDHAVDSLWWARVGSLLGRFDAKAATRFLDAFAEGPQKQALRAAIRARFELSPDELRTAQTGTVFGQTAADAARRELDRRLHHDPSVRLLSSAFHIRPETAALHEYQIRRAIDSEDEATAAAVIASLLDSVGAAGQAEVERLIDSVQLDPQLAQQPVLAELVRRLRWALDEVDNRPRGNSAREARFKGALADAFHRADSDARHFHDLLTQAANGDANALSQLKREYGDEGLLDFMAAHPSSPVAVQIAKALGWRDKDGVLHLDLQPPATGGQSPPQAQSWTLGEKDEAIGQALADFAAASEPGHGETAPSLKAVRLAEDPAHQTGSPAPRPGFHADPQSHRIVADPPHFAVPEDRDVCRIPTPTVREIPLQNRPNYFFRPFPDSQTGSYAGTDENFMIDYGDGTQPPVERKVPGRWDPVPTPDERYLTVPSNDRDIIGLSFYKMSDVRRPPYGSQKAIYEDKQMTGVYQSLGVVSTGGGGATTYRAIVAHNGTLRVRDYTLTPDPSAPNGVRVEAQGDHPNRLCHNLPDLELSLPMISKDGTQMAGVDVKAGVTKIYDLSPDGSCREAINLGIFTGKVDFGYDGDTIAFHVFNNQVNGTEYIDVPSNERLANVYVYKRSQGQMIRITNNTDSNSVYPAFRRDGSLVFLQQPHGAANGSSEKSKLVIVDPRRFDAHEFDQFRADSPEAKARLSRLTALGVLWAEVCSTDSEDISQQSAVLDTLSLGRDRCLKLVRTYWDRFKSLIFAQAFPQLHPAQPSELAAFSAGDLEKTCPAAPSEPTPTPVATDPPGGGRPDRTPQDIIGLCRNCHGRPGFPNIPFDDPAALRRLMATNATPPLSLADDIKRRLRLDDPRAGRMPPGAPLQPGEIQRLIQYLGL